MTPMKPKTALNKKVKDSCVYPGQTMLVALSLMLNFRTLCDAMRPGVTIAQGQECKAIPGTTASIANAITVLKHAIESNLSAEATVRALQERWKVSSLSQFQCEAFTERTLNEAKVFESEIIKRWENWKASSLKSQQIHIQNKQKRYAQNKRKPQMLKAA